MAKKNEIQGTDTDDDLIGTSGKDVIYGGIGLDTLSGDNGSDNIYGEDGDDDINGGSGNDKLYGGLGLDLLNGDDGNDHINGNEDDDVLNGGAGNDRLMGDDGNDDLSGDDGNDQVLGGAGDDTLDGGAGKDKLTGGLGDDTYFVDANTNKHGKVVGHGDTVFEKADQGTDTVISSIDYKLTKNVENLTLVNGLGDTPADINGTGNVLDNVLEGNDGNNTLNGKDGDDQLNGNAGNDILIGGKGADIFVFNTALDAETNVDHIADFDVANDAIYLDDQVFTSLVADVDPVALSANNFATFDSGADETTLDAASTVDTHILYDSATGDLYYDADGSDAGVAVLFARLDDAPELQASDIFIV